MFGWQSMVLRFNLTLLNINMSKNSTFVFFAKKFVFSMIIRICIMNSSLRKTHNDVKAYGTGKSIYYRRLSFAGILLRLMAYLSSIALPIKRWYTSWQPSRSRCSRLSLWKENLLLWCHKSFCRSIILGQAPCKERSRLCLTEILSRKMMGYFCYATSFWSWV